MSTFSGHLLTGVNSSHSCSMNQIFPNFAISNGTLLVTFLNSSMSVFLLIHVIFLLSMLHTSQITDYLWNVLQVLLSTSLLQALQEYEKLVIIIFLLFHILIEILYAAACVAVSHLIPALMQRAFVSGFEGVAA